MKNQQRYLLLLLSCAAFLGLGACESKESSKSSSAIAKNSANTSEPEPSKDDSSDPDHSGNKDESGEPSKERVDPIAPIGQDPKAKLKDDSLLSAVINLLPKSNQVAAPTRGFWQKESFSPDYAKGMPAVRVRYKKDSSKTVDASKESGFGEIKDENAATLIVINAGSKVNSLFEHLANQMAERGFKEGKLRLISGNSEDEKITFWKLPNGAVYLRKLGELVLYADETDSGRITSASYGAQKIVVFAENWKLR